MPDLLIAGLRISIAVVFLIAGIAKLLDSPGCRQMLVAFGVAEVVAPGVAIVLPALELILAMALLIPGSATAAALATTALLGVFTSIIGIKLKAGQAPSCNCFGQFNSAPITAKVLLRNAVLTVMSGAIVFNGSDASPFTVLWTAFNSMATASLMMSGGSMALAAASLILLYQVMRQQGRILLTLETLQASLPNANASSLKPLATVPAGPRARAGLALGVPAPDFRLPDLNGNHVSLADLLSAGRPTLLLFTTPTCGPCVALSPELARWQRDHAHALQIVSISEMASEVASAGHVLIQNNRAVATAYQCWGTPGAVLILANGTVGSAIAQGADAIRELVIQSVARASYQRPLLSSLKTPPVYSVGDRPLPIPHATLDGIAFDWKTVHGRETVLLFWNSDCGFCQRMLSDLRELEKSPLQRRSFILFSTSSADTDQQLELKSLILSDTHGVGTQFGANGTPMAVLMDTEGKVASPAVAGAEAILKMLKQSDEVVPLLRRQG